jgi:hypothetical protein
MNCRRIEYLYYNRAMFFWVILLIYPSIETQTDGIGVRNRIFRFILRIMHIELYIKRELSYKNPKKVNN